MAQRHVSVVVAAAMSLGLTACGGGSSSVPGGGGGGGTVAPGSLAITPASLSFTGPGAAPQTFTISSTVGNLPAPQVNVSGCSPVASIATTATTLPATYTVTQSASGNCTFVANLGHASAAIGITVGPTGSPKITGTNTVALFVGGTAGSVTVTAPSGTFSAEPTACNGVASVAQTSSSAGAASYSVSPIAIGTCQFPIVNGSSSFIVAVVVNTPPSGPGALQLNASTMDFASPSAPPQQGTVNFTGSVGQVSINENDCIGGTTKPKIAYLQIPGPPPGTAVTLPATFSVTLYGSASGTCVIHFVPQNGTGADLTVTVH